MSEMEQAIESSGADVEDAIAMGLARLGVERDEVEIEVLDEGKRGVLGLGAREAHVRLMPKPQVAPPQPSEAPDEPAAPLIVESVEPVAPEPIPSLSQEKKQAEMAKGVLLELLALMGLEQIQVDVHRAEPAPDEKEPPLVLDVSGLDADLLIGRRGQTMAALQHVTRLIVGRETEGWVHLVIDVGGFKARREKSLQRMAQRMAEQAARTHRKVVLEPMPPHERRVVHMALRDHPDVVTESIGEGERRKVTIIPR
jgi:spoIIIJ-associated protein